MLSGPKCALETKISVQEAGMEGISKADLEGKCEILSFENTYSFFRENGAYGGRDDFSLTF